MLLFFYQLYFNQDTMNVMDLTIPEKKSIKIET